MRKVKRPSIAGHKIVLKFSKQEIAALRRAEAIAERAREIAEQYEDGYMIDLELAQAEHGPGSLADWIEREDGITLASVDYGDPILVFKEGDK